jgi:hypothetical protein
MRHATENGVGYAPLMRVAATRKLFVLALVVGIVFVAGSDRRRALIAEKLARSRRFVSRRAADRAARESTARARWDDDGGASTGGNNATIR